MPKLEQLMAAWCATLKATPEVSSRTLDELENHLRETIIPLLRSGMSETEAFQQAVLQLGSAPVLAAEFQKLNPATWRPVKMVTGAGVLVALLLAVLVGFRHHDVRWHFLLASHIYTLTLGYLITLLTGLLGICFASQRSYSAFSTARLDYMARVVFNFTLVAVCLTGTGLILGAVWSRAEWGRWWQWELKETAPLCVLIWLACFLLVQWLRRIPAQTVLILSMLGNVMVSLAWLGPFVLRGQQHNAASSLSPVLLEIIFLHLAFLLAGLAPEKWLRRHFAK